MFSNIPVQLLGLVLLAVGVCALLTAVARVVARRIGLVDLPDGERKSHSRLVPLMGGVAVFASFVAMLFLVKWIDLPWLAGDDRLREILPSLPISAALFCLLGLWDDKWSIRPWYKFLLQIAAALPFVLWGNTINLVGLFGLEFELQMLGIPFTLFWLVACVNAINLMDGLDGLAGTITAVASLTLACLAMMGGEFGIAVVGLLLFGSVIGFLFHNWPPAKIFLGDSGSLTIGFLIGALALEASVKTATCFTLVIPVVLMGVPMFDTTVAIVRRKLKGNGIGQADRGHIHHCLLDRGLSRTQSLWVIAGLCVAMSAAALLSARLQNDWIAVSLCAAILVPLIVGRVFGYNETVLVLQYVRIFHSLVADSNRALRARLLLARWDHLSDRESEELWSEVCDRVAAMGGNCLQCVCHDQQSQERLGQIEWRVDDQLSISGTRWQFQYSATGPNTITTTLTASGVSSERLRVHRLDDLFDIFNAFQRLWVLENALGVQPAIQTARSSGQTHAAETVPLPASLTFQQETADESDSGRRAA